VGGEVRGNYCTLNPLDQSSLVTLSNGNLNATKTSASTGGTTRSTLGISSGKWYWEATLTASGGTNQDGVGVANNAASLTQYLGENTNGWGYWSNAFKYNNGAGVSYGATYTTNDVIGVALDMDVGTITFYKNGSSQGQAYSGITGTVFPAFTLFAASAGSWVFNFGQRPFAYTAPAGFRALTTWNLPTPAIGATSTTQANKYFDVVLRNGGGSSGGTYNTTVNMSNGALLWDKPRNQTSSNYLVDSVRGISKNLRSNTTDAEATDATWFTGFNSSSFTTGSSDWATTTTVVDWIWAANGAGSSNTAGSITSTVSANTTSGFSVVTYTGNGTNGATVGHGLGVAPSFFVVKERNGSSSWVVYTAVTGNTQFLVLNNTDSAQTASTLWNNTSPTSTVFTVGTSGAVNTNTSTYVAYCFAAVPGYSAFGSYTGNGSTDGAFVYCGFRPRWVLYKSSGASDNGNWRLVDTARSTYNEARDVLFPNDASSELSEQNTLDILSNGFKMRRSTIGNQNGITYIFAAFAESPQKYSLAR
jgi:hypothetical protein